ncbi:MAG: choice-of-anchor D domain-containing protein, partial [Candidatus Marinimicrobia bacterium]|nr:choice-of-anchor D domain-containing protein [Candidatus Neomarinimicrobiota bacterium]
MVNSNNLLTNLKQNSIVFYLLCAVALSAISQPAYAQINGFKLNASDGGPFEEFGYSISISGDYAVVGAYKHDDNGPDAGSAYIFKWTGESWTQETKLLASDGAAFDNFGWSVSISGDYAVVGAYLDDDSGSSSGSAYIFKRTGTTWVQEAKLLPSDGAVGALFGWSVSISGDYAVVGANANDDNGSNAGSAYLFKRTGTSWAQEAKLLASDGAAFDEFGKSVAISGDYAVVGAPFDSDNGTNSGSAYLFNRTDTTWAQEAKLLPSDGAALDFFGWSVSISGDYAVVGSRDDDDNGTNSGSAYLFKRTDTTWAQEAKLLASDGAAFDLFGFSVAISGDYAAVGAFADDDNGSNSGSAYLFKRTDTTWVQEAKLLASDGAADDFFGFSVSISGDYAAVGAFADDDNGSNSGSAYLYNLHNPFVVNPIPDVTADEDFGSIMVALLDTVFNDLDLPNDSLRYTVSVSSGLVSANISGDTLRLFSVDFFLTGTAEVVVTATDDSSSSVSDSFNVTVLPDTIRPNLSFSSDTLDFSTVFIGFPASKQLIVTNLGIDSLFISDISSDNVVFTIDVTSSELGAGGRDTLTVTFSPVVAGSFSGELTFASNDFRDSSKTVHLTGNALVAPVISVTPDSIDVVLVMGDSADHIVTIDNSAGGSDLEWEVTAFASRKVFPNVRPAGLEDEKKAGERIETTEPILLEGALDYAYMAEQTTNSVLVLDTKTNTTVTLVPVGSFPHRLEFSPDGDYVWVANKNDNTTSVIRTSDNTVVETITVGNRPFGMAFSPDGRYVYQAVKWDGNIVVIDTETRNIISTIGLSGGGEGGAEPKDIAITPDGNFAYVVSHSGLVWVIDLSSNTVVQTISGATGGHTIRITRDGSRAYFSEGSSDYPNTMRVINLETNTLGDPIGSFEGSEGFDFTPDERYIYVMDRWADQIQKIDTETNLVVANFTDNYIYNGYGVAISPDGLYGYATVPWNSDNYGIHIFETATDQFVGRLETDKRIREIITFDPTGLPWLTATPESGTLAAGTSVDVELRISALGLRPGNYGAVVEIRSNDPEAKSVRIPLRLKVLPSPIDPPEIVSIVDVPDDQGGWVTLSWRASKDDDFFSDTPVSFYSIWLRNNSPDGAMFEKNEVLLRRVEKRGSDVMTAVTKQLNVGEENLENADVQTQVLS